MEFSPLGSAYITSEFITLGSSDSSYFRVSFSATDNPYDYKRVCYFREKFSDDTFSDYWNKVLLTPGEKQIIKLATIPNELREIQVKAIYLFDYTVFLDSVQGVSSGSSGSVDGGEF